MLPFHRPFVQIVRRQLFWCLTYDLTNSEMSKTETQLVESD